MEAAERHTTPTEIVSPIKALLPSDSQISRINKIANAIFKSRMPLPPSCSTPEAIFAKILIGLEHGLPPMTSLHEIHLIEGKATIPPLLMVASVRRNGLGDIVTVISTDDEATVRAWRHDSPETVFQFRWTMERAKKAGFVLAKDGSVKKNWRNSAAMLLARARAEAWRAVFEELAAGIGYTPVELDAEIDDEGRFVDIDAISSTSTTDAASQNDDELVDMETISGIRLKSEATPAASQSEAGAAPEQATETPAASTAANPVDASRDDIAPPAASADPGESDGERRARTQSEIHTLVTDILKLPDEDWSQIKAHWKPPDRRMTLDELCMFRRHLGTLAMILWAARELEIPDATWKSALERRGALKLADLSDVAAIELESKLVSKIVPFEVEAARRNYCESVVEKEKEAPAGNVP